MSVSETLVLELYSVVNQRMWVMGTKLRSSLKTNCLSSPRLALQNVGLMENSKASLCCNSEGSLSKYQKVNKSVMKPASQYEDPKANNKNLASKKSNWEGENACFIR